MNRILIASVVLALILIGCGGGGGSTSGGGGGGGGSTGSDPVDMILNGATKASSSTHWYWSVSGYDYAFFADGTGAFHQSFPISEDYDFTWVKNGPASLTVSPTIGFSTMAFIFGSIGSGEFVVQLDGNSTFRTFALRSGGLPGTVGGAGQGTVFVIDQSSTSVRVFDRQTLAPLRSFSGGNTELSVPAGIAVDGAAGEIYIVNGGSNTITVHAIGTSGNVAPLRRIAGPATGLGIGGVNFQSTAISGIAVDSTNAELVVVNGTRPAITVFSRSASGNVAPLRTIEGPATGLFRPMSVAVDPVNGEIFVGDGAIRVFSRTANGNVAPLRVLTSAGLDDNALALDVPAGELVLAHGLRRWVFARTAAGSTPQLRSNTTLASWTGLAIDSNAADWVACSRNTSGVGRVEIFLPNFSTKIFRDVGGLPMGVALGP